MMVAGPRASATALRRQAVWAAGWRVRRRFVAAPVRPPTSHAEADSWRAVGPRHELLLGSPHSPEQTARSLRTFHGQRAVNAVLVFGRAGAVTYVRSLLAFEA